MTGNLVLLVLNAVQHDWRSALRHTIAIVSFALGVSAARYIPGFFNRIQQADMAIVGLEMAIFASVSLMPAAAPDTRLAFCVAFAAALQVEAFKIVEGYPYSSTFTTGNPGTLVEGICDWIADRRMQPDRTMQVLAVICGSFCTGALAGALLTPIMSNHTLWVVILLLGHPLHRLVGKEQQRSVSAAG